MNTVLSVQRTSKFTHPPRVDRTVVFVSKCTDCNTLCNRKCDVMWHIIKATAPRTIVHCTSNYYNKTTMLTPKYS